MRNLQVLLRSTASDDAAPPDPTHETASCGPLIPARCKKLQFARPPPRDSACSLRLPRTPWFLQNGDWPAAWPILSIPGSPAGETVD